MDIRVFYSMNSDIHFIRETVFMKEQGFPRMNLMKLMNIVHLSYFTLKICLLRHVVFMKKRGNGILDVFARLRNLEDIAMEH